MMRNITPLIVLILSFGTACLTDANGAQCMFSDARPGLDGEAYCPDPDVKEKCEKLPAALIDGFEKCAEDTGVEFDSKDADQAAGAAFPCENAYAKTKNYDDCKKQLEEPKCTAGAAEVPDPCKQVVVLKVSDE
jgi:hypothetical protein